MINLLISFRAWVRYSIQAPTRAGALAAFVMAAALAFPRVISAQSEKPPTTAPTDLKTRRELGMVLLNVVDYPVEESNIIVATLLAKGADPNFRSGKEGMAALHALAHGAGNLWSSHSPKEWQDVALLLLAGGADLNEKTQGREACGETPLHAAVRAAAAPGHDPKQVAAIRQAAEFFVHRGASLSIRDASGKTAPDLVTALDESPLKQELSDLLHKAPVTSGAGPDPAIKVALPSDPKAVTLALNQSARNVIEFPGDDAAVLIECLLKVGADPHPGIETGQILLGALAFNSGNTWPLRNNDSRRAAAALIKAGADVNGQRADGRTPLGEAVQAAALNAQYHLPVGAELDMVRFLLDHGADPSIRDKEGKNTLDRAAAIEDAGVRQRVLDVLSTKHH